jgi:hypothetical protein
MQVVRIDAKGRAIDHVVAVKREINEDLSWVALGNGGPWKITFDKGTPSPFRQAQYEVPPGGVVRTEGGPENGSVGVTYKYNVRNGITNAITNDPDVDVE